MGMAESKLDEINPPGAARSLACLPDGNAINISVLASPVGLHGGRMLFESMPVPVRIQRDSIWDVTDYS